MRWFVHGLAQAGCVGIDIHVCVSMRSALRSATDLSSGANCMLHLCFAVRDSCIGSIPFMPSLKRVHPQLLTIRMGIHHLFPCYFVCRYSIAFAVVFDLWSFVLQATFGLDYSAVARLSSLGDQYWHYFWKF